jgi:hypothetical protein
VILPRYNKKRRDRITHRIDSLDYYNPFPITRLDLLCLFPAIRACYNYSGGNNAYYKPSLVKVIDIRLLDRIFRNYILYKLELPSNYSWIFALSPLVIVFTLKTRIELWLSSHKIPSPVLSDASSVTRCENSIYYIFHNTKPRGESF